METIAYSDIDKVDSRTYTVFLNPSIACFMSCTIKKKRWLSRNKEIVFWKKLKLNSAITLTKHRNINISMLHNILVKLETGSVVLQGKYILQVSHKMVEINNLKTLEGDMTYMGNLNQPMEINKIKTSAKNFQWNYQLYHMQHAYVFNTTEKSFARANLNWKTAIQKYYLFVFHIFKDKAYIFHDKNKILFMIWWVGINFIK